MRKTQAVTARIASTAPWFALFVLALLQGACSSSRHAGTAASNAGDSAPWQRNAEDASAGAVLDMFEGLPGDPDQPLTWMITEPIDWDHAPLGHNDSEHILFSHLYTTLFDWTDRGPRPHLAESATSSDGGMIWEIRIRPDLRFSDGSQLRATDVLTAWRMTKERLAEDPADRNRLPWVLLPAPVRRVSDLSFEVTLPFPVPDLPRVLCHPGLAIAVPRPGHAHLVGTGPYAVSPGSWKTGEGSMLRVGLVPNTEARRQGSREVQCGLRRADPRDAVRDGVDLVITRDRSTQEYAKGLGWSVEAAPPRFARSEVQFLVARPELASRAGELLSGADDQDGWRTLRCAIWPPAPWMARSGVLSQTIEHWRTNGLPAIATPRLVYAADDETAQRLAERFAALLSTSGRQVFAQDLHSANLSGAARRGTELGYLFSTDSLWDDPCWTLAEAWLRCPWVETQPDARVWRLASAVHSTLTLITNPGTTPSPSGTGGADTTITAPSRSGSQETP